MACGSVELLSILAIQYVQEIMVQSKVSLIYLSLPISGKIIMLCRARLLANEARTLRNKRKGYSEDKM